jgi:PAS domain S-box-containing protein
VFEGDRIVAVAGVGNKDEPYDDGDVRQLTLLMTGMWWLLQRKKAEEALSTAVERGKLIQTHLIQTCMDGIIANDREGNIHLFNENAARILGYIPDEVIGKLNVRSFTRWAWPGKSRTRFMTRLTARWASWKTMKQWRKPQGRLLDPHLAVRPPPL